MRLAISPAVASVLLTLATAGPSLAWGADGIDVLRAGAEDLRAFDAAIGQSRSRDGQNARSAAKSAVGAAVGAKVSAEARRVHDQRERDIQDSKSYGQWVKSNNNPSGGKGSAATVSDEGNGSGGGSSSQSARDKDGDGSDKGKGRGSNNGRGGGDSQH